MPLPMPPGVHITITKDLRPANYSMPSMEMATDHYNIGYTISGDRKTITPLQSYINQAGDVAMAPPFMYHRTISISDVPYERYMIKFTPEFIKPFFKAVGKNIFDELYEQKVCHFNKPAQIKIERMFAEMLEEYKKDVPYKEEVLRGMLFRLLTTVWENKLEGDTVRFKSPLTKPIVDALYYIEKNYDKALTLDLLAGQAHLSNAYFSRLFSAQLGMSFSEYLSNIRIHHVQKMLAKTDQSVMEIALSCGYCHGDYLAAQFKAKTGMTPSEFRKKSRNSGLSVKERKV